MVAMDALTDRAAFLRDALQKSKANTESIVSTLGSFDHRLSALEAAMRPTQVKTHAIRMAHENIDKTLKSADVILSQFDRIREAENKVGKGPHEDLQSYLEAIDQLRSVLRFFSSNKTIRNDVVVNRVNNLLSRAISNLEEEFRGLLGRNSKPVDPDRLLEYLPNTVQQYPGTHEQQDGDKDNASGANNPDSHAKSLEASAYAPPTLIAPKVLPLLCKLAQQLVQAGHQQQCLKVYREVRSSALEKSLSSIGVEKLSKEEVQKLPWDSLEAKINNWIHFMRIAVKLLFSGERQLCDQIFEGASSLKDQCLAEVTSSSMTVLLNFGEAISRSKRSPEKLFVLLDMYEVMHELQPEIESIFEAKACSELRESAVSLTKRLALTAQETLTDFEDAVEKDVTKTMPNDGTVHPLTSYVINYVKFLFDYQSTLKQLFQDLESGDKTNSNLASMTMKIMQALQSNLDAKSKIYKDTAMAYVFLMNNIHYIVKSVRRSEAKDLLGDDWIQRHRRIVQQNANQYRRVAWGKILQSLSAQGLISSGGSSMPGSDGNSSGVSRAAVKERFKSFNSQLDELIQRQSEWAVPDQELRESLRLAVAEVLLPAYRSFIKRFGPLVDNSVRYIKYNPDELETHINFLFEGKNSMEPKSRS